MWSDVVEILDWDRVEDLKSEKLKRVIMNQLMFKELKALLLMRSPNVMKYFSFEPWEMEELKSVFNPEKLISLGPRYIREYLKDQLEHDTLEMYNRGEVWIKSRHGFCNSLSQDEKKSILEQAADETMFMIFDEPDIVKRTKVIQFFDEKHGQHTKDQGILIDEIQELLKDEDF